MSKVRKLDRAYEDIDKTYGGASEEEMKKAIENLEKEIEGKRDSLNLMEDPEKAQALEANIKTLETRLNNLKGYSKNKVQIEKIQKYKSTLQEKLSKEIEKEKTCKEKLKQILPELEKVQKQLKDEKYTMTLDQDEYNDLLQKREDLTKELYANRDGKDMAAKRIVELKGKIGKCDLAWRTLFVNKDWDEIQRIAISDEKRFTRKVDEKHPPVKAKKEASIGTVQQEIAENVSKIMKEERQEKAEGESLPAKVSRWTKFKNFVKNIPNKFRAAFGKDKPEAEEKQEQGAQDKTSSAKKDAFLEGLRQYADEEYKKQVREEREAAYIDTHKAKSKEETESKEESR